MSSSWFYRPRVPPVQEYLQQIRTIGKTKPRLQYWTYFLSVFISSVSYRRGKDNASDVVLSRLSTAEDVSGSCALLNPDDLGIYFIRNWGFISYVYPIPAVGLDGLTPLSPSTLGSRLAGLIPQTDPPISGGLPLSHDDFRTHLAPLPLPHMVGSVDRPPGVFRKTIFFICHWSSRYSAFPYEMHMKPNRNLGRLDPMI